MSSPHSEFHSSIGEGESEFCADEEKDRAQTPVAIDSIEPEKESYRSSTIDQAFFTKPNSPLIKTGIETLETIYIPPRVTNHKHKASLEEEPFDVDQTSYLSFLPSAIISDIQGATSPTHISQQGGVSKPISMDFQQTPKLVPKTPTIDIHSTAIPSKAWSLEGLNGPRKYYSLSSDSEYDYHSDQTHNMNKQSNSFFKEHEYEVEHESFNTPNQLQRNIPVSSSNKTQPFFYENRNLNINRNDQYTQQGRYSLSFNQGTHFPSTAVPLPLIGKEYSVPGKENETLEMSGGSESENILYSQENYPPNYRTDYQTPYTSGSDSGTSTGALNPSPSKLRATSATFQSSQKNLQPNHPPFAPVAYSQQFHPLRSQYYYYEREGFVEYEDVQNIEGESIQDKSQIETTPSYYQRYSGFPQVRNPSSSSLGYVPKKRGIPVQGVIYYSPTNTYVPISQNNKIKTKLKKIKNEEISGNEEIAFERPKILKAKSFTEGTHSNSAFSSPGNREEEQKKKSAWKVKYPQAQKIKEIATSKGDSDASTGASLPASASVSPESVSPPSELQTNELAIAGQKAEEIKVEIEKILSSTKEIEQEPITMSEKKESERTPKQKTHLETPIENPTIPIRSKSLNHTPSSPKEIRAPLKKEKAKKESQLNNKEPKTRQIEHRNEVSLSPVRTRKPQPREIKQGDSPKATLSKKETTPKSPKKKSSERIKVDPNPIATPVTPSSQISPKDTNVHSTPNPRSGKYPNIFILVFMGIFTSVFIFIASYTFCLITDCSGQPHISFQIYLAIALIIYSFFVWVPLYTMIGNRY